MDFLTKLNIKTSSILKMAGLAILAIVVLVFAFKLIGTSFNSLFKKSGVSNISISSQGAPSYDYATESGVATKGEYGMDSFGLSIRNTQISQSSMPIYGSSGTTGDDAEEFEVTEYTAYVETRELDKTCSDVAGLKSRGDVIFESSNEYRNSCGYIFKVKKESVADILGIIKGLDPKELSENTYTIKNLVEDFTSQSEILQKKLASIDETLAKAVSAYDNITALATRVQDVETLARIIDSKINIIERLTQERININSQLEMIERSKAEHLDRLEYTYFYVNIVENKIVDPQNLKDSWKAAIKEFVQDVNNIVQDVTINLVAVVLLILQYAIYLLIVLFVAKYGWRVVKRIWRN